MIHRLKPSLPVQPLLILLTGLALCLPWRAQAQIEDHRPAKAPLISDGKPKKHYRLSELSWMDNRHLQQQVSNINDLTSLKLGQPVRGNLDDLALLQRVVYKGLIKREDSINLQALGAVLGNVMVKEFGLQWMVYKDGAGRSRAVCDPASQECLFPITMLSRRMEVGLLPNVRELYDYSFELIEPHLPKLPYSN